MDIIYDCETIRTDFFQSNYTKYCVNDAPSHPNRQTHEKGFNCWTDARHPSVVLVHCYNKPREMYRDLYIKAHCPLHHDLDRLALGNGQIFYRYRHVTRSQRPRSIGEGM